MQCQSIISKSIVKGLRTGLIIISLVSLSLPAAAVGAQTPGFSGMPPSGTAPLAVQFTD